MKRGHSKRAHKMIAFVNEAGDRIPIVYSFKCSKCYICEAGQTSHCENTQKAAYDFGIPFGGLNRTHTKALILLHEKSYVIKAPDAIDDSSVLTLPTSYPLLSLISLLIFELVGTLRLLTMAQRVYYPCILH